MSFSLLHCDSAAAKKTKSKKEGKMVYCCNFVIILRGHIPYMTFRIFLQNLRPIHRNFNELSQFINQEKSKPNVIALTET